MALTDNIAAYWKFDESSGNAADSVGSSTLVNNGTITYSAGKILNGANLASASSQYFTVADNTALSITGDLSIAGWYNFTSTAGTQALAAKRTSTGNQRSYTFYINAGNTLNTDFFPDGSTDSLASVSWTPLTGTWYHIGFAYNATGGSVAFYVNGAQQGTTQTGVTNSIFDSTSPFSIGAYFVGPTALLNAEVDEIGVWSRTLSASEFSLLYNNGLGISYPFATGSLTTLNVG